jgi:peptidase S41-like protein
MPLSRVPEPSFGSPELIRRKCVQASMLCRISVLLAFAALWASAQPAFPDTPAGGTLKAWFEAFNSGDRARMEAYYQKFDPSRPVDMEVNFRNQTGGFELLSITKSERTHIEFRVKEKARPTTAIGRLDVKDANPAEVVSFGLRAIPPGVTEADFNIDAAARQRAIDGAAAKLNEFYVFAEAAKKMEDAIRAKQKAGAYDAITNGDAFAEKLTADLREVSNDKHLRVSFSPAVLPNGPPPGGPDTAAMRRQLERINCGFEKAERLPPNIGYLKFNMFANPDICAPTASAAMNFLGSVDALIIDLRENGGGHPKMVAYISSYLFDERTHLNDLYNRKENKTEEFWTTADVPGKRLGGKPVFVLTAKRTFSGAEEFAYNLKNLERATIIGEITGGGAHPVSGHRIDDHFMIGVPFARAINPISKTNWEGTGVEPDVKVPAADALETAKKLAAKK